MENNLFRHEVMQNKKNKNFGNVFINLPNSYQLIVIGCFLIVLFIIIFISFAEFTEKLTVRGIINSTPTITTIYPERNGIISQSHLKEGQHVNKNDILFVVNTISDHISSYSIAAIIIKLNNQKEILEKEINRRKNYLKKLHELVGKNFVSIAEYNQKYEEIINLKINKNTIEQEIIKYKHENKYVIRSPIDGEVSNILKSKSETVDLNKPLVKIIPTHFKLNSVLFVPVNQARFLNKN